MIVPFTPEAPTRLAGAVVATTPGAPAPRARLSIATVPAPAPSQGKRAMPVTPAKSCAPLPVTPGGCQAAGLSDPNGIVTDCQPVNATVKRVSQRSPPAS